MSKKRINKYKKKKLYTTKYKPSIIPTFRVDVKNADDIKEIITLANQNDVWMVDDLKNLYLEDWEDYDGLSMIINLFHKNNNADDYITSIDELKISPKIYFADLKEGTYETINKENFINIIKNYKTDERLNKLLDDKKDYLYNLILNHPLLSIGQEVISYIDIKYKFYKKDYFKPAKIKGYTLINNQWFLRTTSGYSSFNGTESISIIETL